MKRLAELLLPDEILASRIEISFRPSRLAVNTQQVVPGSLFFAIHGKNQDGHAFIEEAIRKGAAAVAVEDPSVYRSCDRAILLKDTRSSLAMAASRWWDEPSRKLKLVGVTGTNGKTTAIFLFRQVWQKLRIPNGGIGTVGFFIGDNFRGAELTTPGPLELQEALHQMVANKATHAAMEVTSIALDQRRTWGTHFEGVAFTNLTQDHLDYHGNFETYHLAKRKLFQDYEAAFSVLNIDDPAGLRLLEETASPTRLTYSLKDPLADFFVKSAQYRYEGTRAILATPTGELSLVSPLVGTHNLYNLVTVLTTTHGLGMDLKEVATALADATGAPGRLERVNIPERHIFVDYAHTDDALDNVLRSLAQLKSANPHCRIFTVFGCGGERDRTKRPKMGRVASHWSDVTIATSDNPRNEDPEQILNDIEPGIDAKATRYLRESDRRRAIQQALDLSSPGDIVLIAGKGHETYQILGAEKIPFDDREVIQDYYGIRAKCSPGSNGII